MCFGYIFWLWNTCCLSAQLEEEGFDLDFMLGRRKTDRQKLTTVTSSFSTGWNHLDYWLKSFQLENKHECILLTWFLLFGYYIWDLHTAEAVSKWKGWTSLVAQRGKNLPAVQEIRAQSLGWEDPLEKEMATHFSILAWRIPWTQEHGGLQSMRSQRARHDWACHMSSTQMSWFSILYNHIFVMLLLNFI